MRATAFVTALAAFAVPALGELAVTSPTGDSICRGGQRCSVAWNDNNVGVTLAQQGNSTFALYTGGKTQQTFLQPIAFPAANAINVAGVASVEFTVDPTIGEDGKFYFIRITSNDLKNPTAPTQPYLSFSAVFTLEGMSGTFNQTVKDQLKDVNVPPSSSSSSGSSSSSTPAATTTGSRAATSSSAARTSSTSSARNSTGAAFANATPVTATGVVAFIGTLVGLFL